MREKKGITLIALVITIIILLILAGVSLNATVGDNGIITQARNVTYQQGIAILEEYLQQEYVQYYDEADQYSTKVELLASKIKNLCLKDGTKNYIIYNGKMYYLVNKNMLSQEISSQLRGGDTNEYAKYIRLQDVYGITEDLKVYYCIDGLEGVLGNISESLVDPNMVLTKIKGNEVLNKMLIDILTQMGVTIGENGITYGNVSALKELTLDGSKYPGLTSLYGISELTSLKSLTIKDVSLGNLQGLGGCSLLNYLFLQNCTISNYDELVNVLDLKYLYLYNPPNNLEIENLSKGLSKSKLTKLEYFGIFGYRPELYSTNGNATVMYTNTSAIYSNITDISSIANISTETKNAIKYMYLNNNKITSIECLKGFTNIYNLYLMENPNLVSLNGLQNHEKLTYVCAQKCKMSDLSGLSGCTNLLILSVHTNSSLTSLSGLESSSKLTSLYAYSCNILSVSELQNLIKLNYLSLYSNVNLTSVAAISKCIALKTLYLESNVNMNINDVIGLESIIANCTSYTIPGKYLQYFSTVTSYNYTNYGLNDYSEEIQSLKNRTNVTYLRLYGNSNLASSRIGLLIKGGNLKLEELSKIKENLSLTSEENNIINLWQGYSETQIKNMSDTEIEQKENNNDIYLRYILSTMTGLTKLSVANNTNLTSIDFVNKVKNLIELDVRNTNLTNLSLLEENALKLNTLAVSNSNTNMKVIQKTISRLGLGSYGESDNVITNAYTNDGYAKGILICGTGFLNSFKDCTEITAIRSSGQSAGTTGQQIDLSTCTGITTIISAYCRSSWTLPYSVTNATATTGDSLNMTNCVNLKSLSISQCNSSKVLESMLLTAANSPLTTINMSRCTGNLNVLANLTAAYNTLTSLSWTNDNWGYNTAGYRTTGNCSGLKNFNKLSTLNLYYHYNKDILVGISDVTSLTSLNVSTNDIGDINELSTLVNLTNLNLNTNKVSNISSISNLTKLQTLYLNTNSVYNLQPLESLIINGKTNLINLYLNNNTLENYTTVNVNGTITSINNIEILKKLNQSGLRTLNISGNIFQDTSEIKNLSWYSYVE